MALFNLFNFSNKNFRKFVKDEPYFLGFSNFTQNTIEINNDDDVLIAYQLVPTVNAIINRLADLFARVNIKVVDNQENEIENNDFLEVLKNPHPFYAGTTDFLRAIAINYILFKKVYFYVNRKNIGGLLTKGDTILVLPSNDVTPIYNQNINIREVSETADYIKYYEFYFENQTIKFLPHEIIKIDNDFDKNNINLQVLENACNTILSAYQVTNTLQTRNGGFGIITKDGGNSLEEVVNDVDFDNERDKVQNELKKYSFSQKDYNFIITSLNLKYQPITYPIKDMNLNESVLRAKIDICDVLQYPIISLNNLEGSTFTNMETADRKIYTDTIIPIWNLLEKFLNNNNFLLEKAVIDYSNIAVLRENEKEKTEIQALKDNLYYNRFVRNLITYNQLRIACGLDEVSGGDYYYSDNQSNTNENEN